VSLLTRSPPARKTGSGNFEPKTIPDQEQAAYPRSPSEECQDELSISHKARKGTDIGEQLDNESTSSPFFCPRMEGVGVSPTAMSEGNSPVCNATATVPEERTGTEDLSNNVSGSERL
jgi:hypothetical protein